MQSFLIVSKDKNKASEHINNFLKKEEIDALDISQQVFEKAMGIPDVRNIQKKILLKPFKSKSKAIVIDAPQGITTQAQNSLLKVLEEPPINTFIFIKTSQKETILPTIQSRCTIIELKAEGQVHLENYEVSYNSMLETIFEGRVGDKLKIAQDLASDKEEMVAWLEKMSLFVRSKLLKNPTDTKYIKFLKDLQRTYVVIKSTNVSPRTALESLLLSQQISQ